jgi:hypothetical protein
MLNFTSLSYSTQTNTFFFPSAWISAALLPLPPKPQPALREKNPAHGRVTPLDFTRQVRQIDETRYESARWWRNLNRLMAVIGLFIIGAIVALIVVGVHQGWTIQSGGH